MHPRTLSDWLESIERIHPKSIDMGLERIRVVAARMGLGRPAARVVTVGGTNGKGSTVAFIEAIAREAGLQVGAYTSPHIRRFNERIRIDGRDAADAEIVGAFEAIEAARLDGDGIQLTYFEFATLAALSLFERAALDVAVLEVGLGGRLDATNVVDADAMAITTVDLDHQDYLGPDRESIGFEKAGIARPWKPLVLGDDDPPASVVRHAYAIGAQAIRARCDFFFEPVADADGAAREWVWREVGHAMTLPMPALLAPVQLRNAAVAVAAVRALDLPVADDAVARGIASARIAGRLQGIERDGVLMLLDVAHNPQAARALAGWLQSNPIAGSTHAVFAALGDKDVHVIAQALAEQVARWHVAGLAGPRGTDADALVARLPPKIGACAQRHVDVATALGAARADAQAGDRVLVFGSFHTVAAALDALDAH